MKKHTLGPWRAWWNGNYFDINCAETPGDESESEYNPTIASVHENDNYKHTRGNVKANAHLIAAAPEMLEALEMVMIAVDYQKTDLHDTVRDFINSVIRKAKGGTE